MKNFVGLFVSGFRDFVGKLLLSGRVRPVESFEGTLKHTFEIFLFKRKRKTTIGSTTFGGRQTAVQSAVVVVRTHVPPSVRHPPFLSWLSCLLDSVKFPLPSVPSLLLLFTTTTTPSGTSETQIEVNLREEPS